MWKPNLKVIRLIRMNQSFINHKLGGINLSSGLYYFMLELSTRERMTMSELSAAVGVDNGHCSRAIKRLVDLGYVSRLRDRTDRRSMRVALTESGRIAAKGVTQAVREWVEIIQRDIPQDEIVMTNSVIDRYCENASAFSEPGDE
ncbi:MAG: MarR family transcriptional regulator [Spirochaetes bacterium]|nr:MarR family transcriptional regulator [Spirochaetota bacterium]